MMKKKFTVVIIVILVLVRFSWAQEVEEPKEKMMNKPSYTYKGRVLLGANTGFSFDYGELSISNNQATLSTLSVSPSIMGGYFVMNNFMVGGLFSYQYTRVAIQNISSISESINFNILARYYIKNIYVTGGYSIEVELQDGSEFGYIPLEVGYAFFLNKNFSIDPSLGCIIGVHNNRALPGSFRFRLRLGMSFYLR